MNIYFTIGFMVASFIAGWTTDMWYTGYKGEHAAIIQEHKAAIGETKIIHDTQVVTKVVTHEKSTDCSSKPIAPDLLKQLR